MKTWDMRDLILQFGREEMAHMYATQLLEAHKTVIDVTAKAKQNSVNDKIVLRGEPDLDL